MALSEEDRRRIEEEEYRRVARERALQSADPPPSVPSGSPAATSKESANLQTGLGAGLVGSGVAGLFIFPPIGISVIALGAINLMLAKQKRKLEK